VPIYKPFLVTDAERKHVMRSAFSVTSIRKVSSNLFPAKEGAEGNSLHFDRNMKESFPQRMPQSRNG